MTGDRQVLMSARVVDYPAVLPALKVWADATTGGAR